MQMATNVELPNFDVLYEGKRNNKEEEVKPLTKKELDEVNEKIEEKHKYNLKGELVEMKPYLITSRNGKEYVHVGKLTEYIINKNPAIYVTGRFFFYRDGVYVEGRDGEEKTIIKEELGVEHARNHIINDVANMWKIDDRVSKYVEDINPDPYILNLKNGLYDIRTREVKPHTPEYLSTIQINANYDREAKGPRFLNFIQDAIQDKDSLEYFRQAIAYGLTNFIENKERIFFIVGDRNSGKSTALNVTLEALLPKNAKSHTELQQFQTDKFATAELFGKTANIYGDLSPAAMKEISVLKSITGRDGITSQRKFGNPFHHVPVTKFYQSMNTLPSNNSQDTTDAFYVRLGIILFDNPKKDEELDFGLEDHIINNELDFVLTWLLDGLDTFVNKQNFNFTKAEKVKEQVKKYEEENNSLIQFINDMCILEEEATVPTRILLDHYEEYCTKVLRITPKQGRTVRKFLVERYGIKYGENVRHPNTRQRAFGGIKLKRLEDQVI